MPATPAFELDGRREGPDLMSAPAVYDALAEPAGAQRRTGSLTDSGIARASCGTDMLPWTSGGAP
jgi:hypothetical protein